jgi:hypothetical protein
MALSGRLITVELLIKGSFCKKVYNIFDIKGAALVGTKRSTVLSLPLQ